MEKLELNIPEGLPKIATPPKPAPCPICDYWDKHPCKLRYSTPVFPVEVHAEIVAGFWLGMAYSVGHDITDTKDENGKAKASFCPTHAALLRIMTEKENIRLAEEKKQRDEAERAAEYKARIDALANQVPPLPPRGG
jgi:hypothetical protein